MQEALGAPPLEGLILDAGCGEGHRPGDGGARSRVRGRSASSSAPAASPPAWRGPSGLERAHVVQGDCCGCRSRPSTFDAPIHTASCTTRRIRRAPCARSRARSNPARRCCSTSTRTSRIDRVDWRVALAAGQQRACRHDAHAAVAADAPLPAAFAGRVCALTLPSRHFRWARRFPYRHGTTPWSMSGDLYDRLVGADRKALLARRRRGAGHGRWIITSSVSRSSAAGWSTRAKP